MFIHLGEEIVIRSEDVVAIIDAQLLGSSTILSEFIAGHHEQKRIVDLANGQTKSVVVTKTKVYFSPLASITLKRRSQMISELDRFEEKELDQ